MVAILRQMAPRMPGITASVSWTWARPEMRQAGYLIVGPYERARQCLGGPGIRPGGVFDEGLGL